MGEAVSDSRKVSCERPHGTFHQTQNTSLCRDHKQGLGPRGEPEIASSRSQESNSLAGGLRWRKIQAGDHAAPIDPAGLVEGAVDGLRFALEHKEPASDRVSDPETLRRAAVCLNLGVLYGTYRELWNERLWNGWWLEKTEKTDVIRSPLDAQDTTAYPILFSSRHVAGRTEHPFRPHVETTSPPRSKCISYSTTRGYGLRESPALGSTSDMTWGLPPRPPQQRRLISSAYDCRR